MLTGHGGKGAGRRGPLACDLRGTELCRAPHCQDRGISRRRRCTGTLRTAGGRDPRPLPSLAAYPCTWTSWSLGVPPGARLVPHGPSSRVVCAPLSLRHYFYKCYVSGLRLRTTVVAAVYRKSLVLSLRARHASGGPGAITNLAGVDAQRLQDLMTYLHAVWYSFLQIGLALYFLWGQVGPSCLAGVGVIACLIPTTRVVAMWLMGIQKALVKARDERVALNGEVLSAMKIIKIQAWEESFRAKLTRLRDSELVRLRAYFLGQTASMTIYSAAPLLVALTTFAAYTLAGHRLDVAEALTALALFEILRFPLFMLPQIINRIVEAGISLERVREFLLSEEYRRVGEGDLTEKGEVVIRNGTFVYGACASGWKDGA